jgi:hypothetical protein
LVKQSAFGDANGELGSGMMMLEAAGGVDVCVDAIVKCMSMPAMVGKSR